MRYVLVVALAACRIRFDARVDAGAPSSGDGADQTLAADTAGDGAPSDWWNPAWRARVAIQIDLASPVELVDFPILVTLPASFADWAEIATEGSDLRFVDHGVEVPYEREQFVHDQGAQLWVRAHVLAGTPTVVTMYFANPVPTNPPDPLATWSNGFAGVYHFCTDPLVESAQHYAVTLTSGAPMDRPGVVGRARFFDSNNPDQAVSVATDFPLGDRTACTWVQPGTIDNQTRILVHYGGAAANHGFALAAANNGGDFLCGGAGSELIAPGALLGTPWSYACCTVATVATIFINGNVISTAPAGWIVDPGTDAEIGGVSSFDNFAYADLDELRISAGVRSPAWIAAEYRSMTVAATFGPVEHQ